MDENQGWWSRVFDYDYEQIVRPKQEIVDFNDVFTTNEIFGSRDELLNWVYGTAMEHSFVVVIIRSDSGGNGRKTNIWIIPHKEKFVGAWIDRVMHLRNTTSNRVESAHVRLKRLLQDSRGNICNCWDAMNNLIILQHIKVNASFQRSIMNVEYRMYFGFIPVEKVHAHWRRLTLTDQVTGVERAGLTLLPELDELERRFDDLDMNGKVAFKYKVHELAFPNTTSMCPPPEKVRTKGSTKGESQKKSSTKRDPSFFEYVNAMQSPHDSNSTRPSSSILRTKTPKRKRVVPMIDQFPTVMHDFNERVTDVARDGNCGYHAISTLLGMGEESWPIIRQELYKELQYWHHDYAELFGNEQRCYQLRNSLLVDGRTLVSVDKWMTLSDIGYVVASRYNVVLVLYLLISP
ncbi:Protein FAR-RED IMPAIRED RESPONSE 1 [Sesbania bispinosa]|nr:Protein FAR-RED IMPAIRED RESPONSE 1 [Sesbania bispinosa]